MTGYMNAEILGKNRGIKFGMLAVEQIMEEMTEDGKGVRMLYEMLYWGLYNNCYVKKEVPDFTKEQVCDWVDENITNVEFFEKLGQCFQSCSFIKTEQKEEKKSKPKKVGTS